MDQPAPDVPGLFPPAPHTAATRHFKSSDFHSVRAKVGDLFCDHSMSVINARATLDTRIIQRALGNVSLTDMQYGANVLIDAGRLENFYLVQMPLTGKAHVTLGSVDADFVPGTASVQHPVAPLQMSWSDDCRKLVLRFERGALERFLEIYIGKPQRNALLFDHMLDLSSMAGRAFAGQVQSAVNALRLRQAFQQRDIPKLLETHLETCLMSSLAFLHRHDQTESLDDASARHEPEPVRRVRDFLEENAHEPIDMIALGHVAGIPVRTLYHQFRRALDISPMQLLREIRLERVRRELLQSPGDASVTEIAMNWGFEHLGRFAAAYRNRYGETPRETLKRGHGSR